MAHETVVLDQESSAILADVLDEGLYPDKQTAINQAFRALRDQNKDYAERSSRLYEAIEEGFRSGIAEGDVVARVRAKTGLPPRSVR